MSQPVAISPNAFCLKRAGHDRSRVSAIAPRFSRSRQLRRVSFTNPFTTTSRKLGYPNRRAGQYRLRHCRERRAQPRPPNSLARIASLLDLKARKRGPSVREPVRHIGLFCNSRRSSTRSSSQRRICALASRLITGRRASIRRQGRPHVVSTGIAVSHRQEIAPFGEQRRQVSLNPRESAGRSNRYGRVSRPAARRRTRSQPSPIASMMTSSMTLVRATSHQPLRIVRGAEATIARPRSPASRSASGSWNNASGRADYIAR
jgi:hypothetical protein